MGKKKKLKQRDFAENTKYFFSTNREPPGTTALVAPENQKKYYLRRKCVRTILRTLKLMQRETDESSQKGSVDNQVGGDDERIAKQHQVIIRRGFARRKKKFYEFSKKVKDDLFERILDRVLA